MNIGLIGTGYWGKNLLRNLLIQQDVKNIFVLDKNIKNIKKSPQVNYFDSKKMSVPEDVLNKMQRERRGFDLFGKTEDPKIHNLILKGQKKVLKHFTDSRVLKRLSDSSLYGNEYYPNELIEDLTKAIFNKEKLITINTLDQNLQNYYLKRLILIVKSKKYD